jgi:hypothetical protein
MKPGRKPTPGITTGLYFDYCTGLSIPQVAEKWNYSLSSVYQRFKRMGLPLRPVAEKCACGKRNPHPQPKGIAFEDANRERTRIANEARAAEMARLLATVTVPRWREVIEDRMKYPEMNLAELGAVFDPPMSKDMVSGVLRRARQEVS